MLRFASSPTGEMHIGSLRVALFNYIVSKQKKEDLIVRIEDTDKEKNIEGKDKEILDILGLFGIEYSQVIYQSESLKFHTAMALQLIHDKNAFSCFCSSEWLDGKKEEAKANNKPYMYDDACANLPHELVIDNTSPFTIRIKKPEKDLITDIDSFIILNQDKSPTESFSCAVDDLLNNISLVIRDEEHIANTPKQVHIRTLLNYDRKIQYVHLPSILNQDDTLNLKQLLEEGFLPEAISNYLISIGNKPPKDIFSTEEAIEWFDLDKISKSPARFSMDILRHINQQHLLNLDAKELSRYVGFADEEIGKLAKIYLKEVSTTLELKAKIGTIFAKKNIPSQFTDQAAIIIPIIKKAPYFAQYNDFKSHLMQESGLKDENISKALPYILTGADDATDMEEVYKYIKNYIVEIVK